MTFEQWQASDQYAAFLDAAGGDVDLMRRSFVISQRHLAEWAALRDLCGPQRFIDFASGPVEPWHRALALAVGRADPAKGKIK